MTPLQMDIDRFAKRSKVKMEALARQTVQALGAEAVDRTPVDTGFLRGSWQPSIGAPADADGIEDPSGAVANGRIAAVVANMKAGDTVYMMNNAVYGKFVEFGTATMAGRFFVTETVKRWKDVVREVIADLKGAK